MIILTGDIKTGKTTSISRWCNKRKDVGGFLTPDVKGKRHLLRLTNKIYADFEVDSTMEESELISVGRFKFLRSSFDLATSWILEDVQNEDIKYIVIDELGKLELEDSGFYRLINKLSSINYSAEFIIVIRSYLVEKALQKFKFSNPKIIQHNELYKL